MDRDYILRLHRDARVGAAYRLQLLRPAIVIDDPSSMTPIVDVEDDTGGGLERVFELLLHELIDYVDDHGVLP